jgi:2-hydroxychromene-2-carboxylate isomerase
MARRKVKYYSDFKSPYAYLAKDVVYALERDTGAEVDWLPYTLDIPSYLGSAEVVTGKVIAQNRNAHQWRRVKYSYMDCRREANLRGLTIRGPQKIFDSSLANIGLLYAKLAGDPKLYIDRVFERFWKRELDIEQPSALVNILGECGIDAGSFADYSAGPGRMLLNQVQADAEAQGVFGVPSFLLDDGDLYWGREHLPRIRQLLSDAGPSC